VPHGSSRVEGGGPVLARARCPPLPTLDQVVRLLATEPAWKNRRVELVRN
jgi:hypothetical protein